MHVFVSAWLPYMADVVGAKPPMRVPKWLGRIAAGAVTAHWMTEARGASNEKAKRELDWQPAWRSWRDGFRYALDPQQRRAGAGTPSANRVRAAVSDSHRRQR